ncbi:hypothetical protein XENORESO_014768 [Xenotaenia resolanae]|uniref:Transposase n=1 Tax=Xenotaenia resolanae TaxID=208358 RepID=A0ABV0WSK2_9TELE
MVDGWPGHCGQPVMTQASKLGVGYVALRAAPPVWGTALSAETAMKYRVSRSTLICSVLSQFYKRLRLAVQKQN